jgi:hypothetical protein
LASEARTEKEQAMMRASLAKVMHTPRGQMANAFRA